MAVCGAAAAAGGGGGRWYFSREQLARSPSRRAGLDPDKELSYRQQAANLLQDMGQRLTVSQLTINTAIVYMHRFYMVQSFTQFHRNSVAPAALFLAAKVEEQPRKLEHVIKVAHTCLHPQEALPDTRSEAYLQQAQDLVILESIILQTLGFEITIDHPHTHVVKCTQLVRASKDLAQTSYFMATNSLHLTTFSLQYTPPVVACVCIHLACKWSNWEIPVSMDGKHWWEYVDGTVTLELLDELTHEFLQILEKTPNRLKRIRNWRACQAARKSKTDDQGDDDCLSEQTILSMISRSASDTTIAGLMSMSTSSTAGGLASLSGAAGDSPGDLGTDVMSADSWMAQHPSHKLEVSHRASEMSSSTDHPHLDNSSGPFSKQSIKSAPLAKVSLKEYRAKHAEELAAQKRELENMEANVRSQYAYAAQNLLVQQQRERDVQQQENNPSPIILKIPLGGSSDGSERLPTEKPDKTSSALKVRLTAPGDKPAVSSSKPEEIKMRIKVPTLSERPGSSDESSGKSRGEHKEKHKVHSSNHHHNHHSHKHSHAQPVASTKRPVDSKHGNQSGIASHKGFVPICSFRKRPLSEEASAVAHEHQPKISKNSKGPPMPFPFPQHPGHSLDAAGLPFVQGSKTRGAPGKLDKSTAGANGHNMNQAIDYQDTVNMLHSLLSAQGMQPTQPPTFDFVHSYGEYLNPRAAASVDKPRPPPLPSEPPPPLPPLPK
uniref:Cyclin-T1 n=1 Tax=Podarcis muralis TaxID=64176 RepID=A0A670K4C0_PODMU|nr:cyclin-T1 [Podarcis muralis]